MDIRRVTEREELEALHEAVEAVLDPAIQCSSSSFPQPLLESLLYYAEEAPHLDVVAGFAEDGTPAAYVVIDAKTGQVAWLVLVGPVNATVQVVTGICRWCKMNYDACFGVVENPVVRQLHAEGGATITGNRVAW